MFHSKLLRLTILVSLFFYPQSLFAAGHIDKYKEYKEQMSKVYVIEPDKFANATWVMDIIMGVATLLWVGAFCYWLLLLVLKVVRSRNGKSNVRDTEFWTRMIVALFLLVIFLSGLFLVILERLYDGYGIFIQEGGHP